MPTINPSINISIGNCGEKYITSFHNYFTKNESVFIEYSSFFKCGINADSIYFNSLNKGSISKQFKTNDNTSREDLFNQLSENDNVYFLKNSISNAYSDLVNLVNQVGSSINFQIVNINIIISSFEDNSTTLLYWLMEQISDLSISGAINHISVKVFTVISKNADLLNSSEQIITYQNFEEIKTIQSRFNNILHNVIFIDNLNTDAIFLKINEESIGFVLNEFITYLMTNHYKMIGNLLDADFIALGLGTLIFDEKYFSIFFKNRIINQLVWDEQIGNEGVHIFKATEYNSLRNNILYSFLRGEIDFKVLLNKIRSKLDTSKNNFTLLEYKFLLSNLLGQHDSVQIDKPYKNIERISLHDIIFKILNEFNVILENKYVNILDLKKRLDEEVDLENKIAKLILLEKEKNQENIKELDIELAILQSEIKSNLEKEISVEALLQEKSDIIKNINSLKKTIKKSDYENEQLKLFQSKLSKIKNLNKEQNQIVNDTLSLFKEKKIKPEIDNFIKPNISRNIDELQVKREEIVEARKSFFAKLFKPSLKRELISIDKNISASRMKLNSIDERFNEVEKNSTPLFEFIEELDELYKLVTSSIKRIKEQKHELNKQYSNSNLLNYLFVKNVIDKQKLEHFYTQNKNDFKTAYPLLLNKIQSISLNDIQFSRKEQNFSKYLDSLLENKVKSIIQFNIVKYMNGDYNHLKLLKQESLDIIIGDLLKIAKPFFNSDNAFNTNNSHYLMLHNNDVECKVEIDNLYNRIKSCFPSTIPLQLDTSNINKFSIIEIDVIKDFNHIVKYNESKKVYNKLNSDTIIIN